PAIFENGAIYISKIDLIKKGKIRGDKIGYYEMDQYSSIDIDTMRDFEAAERLIK
ncbi:MAG: acylneuraminate cytidylyltransferase family protein, partial [Parcubacteria group bacterium]|nr:acylneuraminate cytidylyltransferase family protein [Parcubacteria group bacterium]